jgi:hypothetical protein
MGLNLPPQGLVQQIVMLDAAAMRLELAPTFETHDEFLSILTQKQYQVAFLSSRHSNPPRLMDVSPTCLSWHQAHWDHYIRTCALRQLRRIDL